MKLLTYWKKIETVKIKAMEVEASKIERVKIKNVQRPWGNHKTLSPPPSALPPTHRPWVIDMTCLPPRTLAAPMNAARGETTALDSSRAKPLKNHPTPPTRTLPTLFALAPPTHPTHTHTTNHPSLPLPSPQGETTALDYSRAKPLQIHIPI